LLPGLLAVTSHDYIPQCVHFLNAIRQGFCTSTCELMFCVFAGHLNS
jgi:hypothetical protein